MEINATVVQKILGLVDLGLVSGLGNRIPGKMCVEATICYALGLPHGDDPDCVSSALRQLKINLNDRDWSSNEARAKGLRRLAVAQLGSRDHLNDVEFSWRVAELAIRKSVPEALRAVASIHKDPAHVRALYESANKCEMASTKENALEARRIVVAASYAAADTAASYAAVSAANATYAAYNAAYAAANATNSYVVNAVTYVVNAADAAASCAAAAAYAVTQNIRSVTRDKSLSDFAEGVVQILIEMKAPGCQWLQLTEKE